MFIKKKRKKQSQKFFFFFNKPQRLIRKKKRRIQIMNIWNLKDAILSDSIGIKKIPIGYYKEFCASRFAILGEIH